MAAARESSKARALGSPSLAKPHLGSCAGNSLAMIHVLPEVILFVLHLKCLDFCFAEVAVLWGNIRNQN